MKPNTPIKPLSIAIALTCATALVSLADLASARGIILDEAIDDYSGSPDATISETRPGPASGYRTTFILEEAYHDYDGRVARDFNTELKAHGGQTDMAAFELVHPPTPIPWELRVTD